MSTTTTTITYDRDIQLFVAWWDGEIVGKGLTRNAAADCLRDHLRGLKAQPTEPLIDPMGLIERAHKAGELSDQELLAFQNSYMPKCSFDNRPSIIRDDRLYLCEECANKHMPRILQRERERGA